HTRFSRDWSSDVCSSDLDAWIAGWNRTLQINLTAAAALCRLAVLHWQVGGRSGRIVNIASRAAHRGDSPDHWDYAASKAGMVARSEERRVGRGGGGRWLL